MRQVVHFAWPPQRCRISIPASSMHRTSFFPASASNGSSPSTVIRGMQQFSCWVLNRILRISLLPEAVGNLYLSSPRRDENPLWAIHKLTFNLTESTHVP